MMIIGIFIGLMLLYKIPSLENTKDVSNTADGKISIIIPARNEEKNIGNLLKSLEKQMSDLCEIIVVDDGSTDKTGEIALSYGVRVIQPGDLPAGWLGKSWASFNGAKHATGEWLLFADADTYFEEAGVSFIGEAFAEQSSEGILSIHPFHQVKKPYESLSSFFHLVTFAASGAFHFFQRKIMPLGAFGQCFICSKKEYFEWGGHEAIKGKVVENMALASQVRQYGSMLRCVSGKGAIAMRMYPNGLKSLIRGWSKSFASGAKATKWFMLLLVIIWLTGCLTFITEIGILFSKWWFLYVLLYAAAMLQIGVAIKKIGSFSFWAVLFFPLHAIFFLLIFLTSFMNTFVRKTASWKGRNIIIEEDAK